MWTHIAAWFRRQSVWFWVGCAVVALGFVLRLCAIDFGAHADEPNIVERAIEMSHGYWHQAWYHWPAQSLMHLYAPLFYLARHLVSTPDYYLLARLVSVVLDTITLILVWRTVHYVSKQPGVGLLAATWYAFSVLTTQQARYATPDAALTLVVIATIACVLAIQQSTNAKLQLKWYVLAGIIFGFGLATKYTAVIALALMTLVYLLNRRWQWQPIIYFGLAALVIHTVLNPYAFGDLAIIQKQLAQEAGSVRLGQDWNDQYYFFHNLWHYLTYLPTATGTVITWLGYVGGLCIVIQSIVRRRWQVTLWVPITAVLYWIGISLVSLHWSRWALPLVPLLIVSASWAWWQLWLWKQHKVWRAGLIVITIVVTIPQLVLSSLYAYSLVQPNTSQQVSAWLSEHSETPHTIMGEVEFLEVPGTIQYQYLYGNSLIQQASLDTYRAQGVDYLIVRTQDMAARAANPERYQAEIDFDKTLKQSTKKVFTAKKQDKTLLQTSNDFEFYQWLFNSKNWSKLLQVNQGETFVIYALGITNLSAE